jgi:CRISPR-associated protein Cmr6
MADDYITSHQNWNNLKMSPFQNPNPVRFLKVRSGVTFTFGFRLTDTVISDDLLFSKELKRELFKKILLDLGIGAKTNVGYGQFE